LPTGCDCNATVQSGDICDTISERHNISTYLAAVNSETIDPGCDNLFIGQVLCLGISDQDCNVTHIMQT
ncbi:uncharacterized protein BJ212DRAFT_1223107, partial [Suillus subaureus]